MTAKEIVGHIDDILSADVLYDESLDYMLTSDDIEWLEEAKRLITEDDKYGKETEAL